jgi:hypothetical protein
MGIRAPASSGSPDVLLARMVRVLQAAPDMFS